MSKDTRNIQSTKLSQRSINILLSNNIKTEKDLYDTEMHEISKFKRLGDISYEEIKKFKEQLSKERESNEFINHLFSKYAKINGITGVMKIDDEFIKYISLYSKNELAKISLAINKLTKTNEVDFDVFKNKHNKILDMVNEYERKFEMIELSLNKRKVIPLNRYPNSMKKYKESCTDKQLIKDFEKFGENFVSAIYTVKNFVKESKSKGLSEEEEKSITRITSLLSEDFTATIYKIFNSVKNHNRNAKAWEILKLRSSGKTLQEIGVYFELTRERVRQLESKILSKLNSYLNLLPYDPVFIVHAELNKEIVSIDDLKRYYRNIPFTEEFVYFFKTRSAGKNSIVRYDKEREFFLNKKTEIIYENASEILRSADKIIAIKDKEKIIRDLANQNPRLEKTLKKEFQRHYKKTGKIYHRGKLSFKNSYVYMLKKHYPKGMKLYDKEVLKEFREKCREEFGEGGLKLPKSSRAIDARIGSLGVLCARGTYIHRDYIDMPESLMEEIFDYIKSSSKATISFNEIFDVFKEELFIRSNVNNRYFLQGLIKENLISGLNLTKDTVVKGELTDPWEELIDYIKNKEIVYREELLEKFPGLTAAVLSVKINDEPSIIMLDKGFMNVENLDIRKEDYEIIKILNEEISEISLSTRKLFPILKKNYSDFISRNKIKSHKVLFSILRYMFNDKFEFSRPYIAKLGAKTLGLNENIVKNFEKNKKITVSQLLDFCKSNNFPVPSVRTLIKKLNEDFLRVSEEHLEKAKNIFIPKKSITALERTINDKMGDKPYLIIGDIEDYKDFPAFRRAWNDYLLRAVVEKTLKDKFEVIELINKDGYRLKTAIVKKSIDIQNKKQLLQRFPNLIRYTN